MNWQDTPCIPGGNARRWWVKKNGPLSSNLCICHRCDNENCKNLNHMFIATQSENIQDMISKGRQNYVGNRGANLDQKRTYTQKKIMSESAIGNTNASKLNSNKVLYIRSSNKSIRELSEELGVSYRVVRFALERKTWKWL